MYLFCRTWSLLPFLAMLFFSSSLYASHGGKDDLKVTDNLVGTGDAALPFSQISVHYSGWLEDGTLFDSSLEKKPFNFTLGAGQVIPGWDAGIRGMRVGGKRQLVIPPAMAYGKRGAGNVIPPDSTLKFEVELLDSEAPPFTNLSAEELAAKVAEGVTLIDVRRRDEWQETGVVAGSVTITAFEANGRFNPKFLDELSRHVDRTKPFMLICRSGNRTATLVNWLTNEGGYPNAENVQEGIKNWIKENRPVVKWSAGA